jgi:hypothetical protein
MNFDLDSPTRRQLGYQLIDVVDGFFASLPDRAVRRPAEDRLYPPPRTPAWHTAIVEEVNRDGQRWISTVMVNGQGGIRTMIISYLSEERHLQGLQAALQAAVSSAASLAACSTARNTSSRKWKGLRWHSGEVGDIRIVFSACGGWAVSISLLRFQQPRFRSRFVHKDGNETRYSIRRVFRRRDGS